MQRACSAQHALLKSNSESIREHCLQTGSEAGQSPPCWTAAWLLHSPGHGVSGAELSAGSAWARPSAPGLTPGSMCQRSPAGQACARLVSVQCMQIITCSQVLLSHHPPEAIYLSLS